MPNIPNFRDLQRGRNSIHSFRNILVSRGGVGGTYDSKLPPIPAPLPPTFLFLQFGDYPRVDLELTNNTGINVLSSGVDFTPSGSSWTAVIGTSSFTITRIGANDWRLFRGNFVTGRYYNNNSSSIFAAPTSNWTSQSPAFDPSPEFIVNPSLANYFSMVPSNYGNDFYFTSENKLSITGATSSSFVPVSLTISDNCSYLNTSRFSELTSLTMSNTVHLTSLDVSQNLKLKILTLTNLSSVSTCNFSSNNQLETISFSNVINLRSVVLSNNPNLTNISIATSPQLKNLDLSNANALTTLTLNTNASLSSVVMITPPLRSVNITNTNLSADIVDTFYTLLSSNSSSSTFQYTGTPQARTSASNGAFINIYKKASSLTPFELDPSYPALATPSGYIPSNLLGNSMTVLAPVSGSNSVKFTSLTGNYLKTGDIYNDRDTFKNAYNYFILYNSGLNLWTLVGPASTSNTVWLSANPGVGDWGNPPSGLAWGGRAYNSAATSSGWFQRTSVFSTQMLLFSSYSYNDTAFTTGTEIAGEPLSGYNGNFFWKDLDFTGIVYSGWLFQGRATMISPVHCIFPHHYPPGFEFPPNNNTVYVYGKDGTRTTVTMVTGVRIASTDIAVGILNTPVNVAQYPVLSGTNNFVQAITGADSINRFLYGPNQQGKIGVSLPVISVGTTSSTRNTNPSTRNSIFSIPNSLWMSEVGVTGDSSSQHWVVSGGRLIVAGHTQSGGTQPSGPSYGFYYDSIVQAVTALNVYQYGPGNSNLYSITGVSF